MIRSASGTTSVGVDGFQDLILMVSGYLLVDDETDAPTRVSMKRFLTAIQPVVLYDGSTLDDITLPESTANFSDIRIYYNVSQWCRGSVDVHNPNGTTRVQMQGIFQATDTIAQYRFRSVYIQGNEIKTQSSGYINFTTSGSLSLHFGDNDVYIERIIGWR